MKKTDIYSEASGQRPLVATMEIASPAREYFNRLRAQHFPPERNYLQAHLTLFHALPHEPWIIADLQELANNQQVFEVTADSIMSLGGGTAFKILSDGLPAMHQALRKRWFGSLTVQDQQKRNFHITIQNKVEPQMAKQLQSELIPTFEPFRFEVTGIQLWRYLGGPWEYLMTVGFGREKWV